MDEKNQGNNVAKEFNIGKTRVKICTDYCVEGYLEIEKILNNIAQKALPNLNSSSLNENTDFNV